MVDQGSMAVEFDGLCPLLQVFDMRQSLALYRDTLGFRVVSKAPDSEEPDWVWLTLNSSQLMLNTAYEAGSRPSAPDPRRMSAHSDVTLFFGCEDIDGMYLHLQRTGWNVQPPVTTNYGIRQLNLRDPDGYGICFQWNVES